MLSMVGITSVKKDAKQRPRSLWPPLILELKVSSSGHPAIHWGHLNEAETIGFTLDSLHSHLQ